MHEQESLAWRERYGHRTHAKTPDEEVAHYRKWYARRIGERIGKGYEVGEPTRAYAPQDVRFTIRKEGVPVGFVFPLRRPRAVFTLERHVARAYEVAPLPEEEFKGIAEILRKL